MKHFKRSALIIILSLAITATFLFIKNDTEAVNENKKTVLTEKVSKGTIDRIGQYTGIVKGEQEAILSPKTTGVVTKLLKKEGDFVKKGELLAVLDGTELYAESSLTEENVTVSKKSLKETGIYYDQLVDEAKATFEKSQESYLVARKNAEDDTLKLLKKDLEKSKEALKSARRLRDLQINAAKGRFDLSKEQNAVADSYLNNVRLVAPFSGMITSLNSQLGALVSPGSSVYTLSSSSKKEVEISIASNEASLLSVGQKVRIFAENLEETEGVIFSISPLSDFKNRKSEIKITVSSDIRLGTYVRTDILLEKKADAILVPTEAIIKKYNDEIVFVSENGKARQKIIRTGIIENGQAEILSGLSEGEIIISRGHHYLRDGDDLISKN